MGPFTKDPTFMHLTRASKYVKQADRHTQERGPQSNQCFHSPALNTVETSEPNDSEDVRAPASQWTQHFYCCLRELPIDLTLLLILTKLFKLSRALSIKETELLLNFLQKVNFKPDGIISKQQNTERGETSLWKFKCF